LFEFLALEQQLKRSCVVRSAHNRSIRIGHDGQGKKTLLHKHMRTLPAESEARSKDIFDRTLEKERTAKLRVDISHWDFYTLYRAC